MIGKVLSDDISELDRWLPHFQGVAGRKVLRGERLGLESPVYHRLEWGYAKSIFQNARLRLSPIRTWPDPYEEWCCSALFGRAKTGLLGVNVYALCFATSRYDEPAWRMVGYGRSEPIVRIRCSVSDLLTAATDSLNIQPGAWFFGSVRYCPERSFQTFASKLNLQGFGKEGFKDVARTAASILLRKRRAFRFEKEVRLIFFDQKGSLPKDEVFLPINPAIISDVMISPYNHDSFPVIAKELAAFGEAPRKSSVMMRPSWMAR